jgi:hypothetical protein
MSTAEQRYLSAEASRDTHLRLARYIATRDNRRGDSEVAWHLYKAETWNELRDRLVDTDPPAHYTEQDVAVYWKALAPHYDPEAEYLAMVGRLEKHRGDPLHHLIPIASYLRALKLDRAAESVLRKSAALAAGNSEWLAEVALERLGLLLAENERLEEAIETAKTMVRLRDGAYPRLMLGVWQMKAGFLEDAEQNLAAASRLEQQGDSRRPGRRETIDLALAKLRQALPGK